MATLLQLLERETKREKVLEVIQREKLLKLRTAGGLKTVRNKMNILGLETLKTVATRKTETDIKIEEAIGVAEKKFYDAIEKDLRNIRDPGKPVCYDQYFYDD